MFRLLGFCVGSALAVALLVALVGMPIVVTSDNDTDTARFSAAVEKLKAKRSPAPVTTDGVLSEPSIGEKPAADEGPVDNSPTDEEAAAPIGAQDEDSAIASIEPPEPVGDVPAESLDEAQEESSHSREWHVFWTPFRSEIAASGFKNRLEAVTGLDYRIVRRDVGDYQVMFAYAGERELSLKLKHISAATGLDLSGGLP